MKSDYTSVFLPARLLPSQCVTAAEAVVRVLDLDLDDAVVVARIDLFEYMGVIARLGDRRIFQVLDSSQLRIEWEEDFVPWREVALRLAGLVEAAAFQIAEMADVVYRRVPPHSHEGLFPFQGERRVLLEERVEGDLTPVVPLAPDAEVPGEPLAQFVAGPGVRRNRQHDGRRRVRIGRTPNLLAVLLS